MTLRRASAGTSPLPRPSSAARVRTRGLAQGRESPRTGSASPCRSATPTVVGARALRRPSAVGVDAPAGRVPGAGRPARRSRPLSHAHVRPRGVPVEERAADGDLLQSPLRVQDGRPRLVLLDPPRARNGLGQRSPETADTETHHSQRPGPRRHPSHRGARAPGPDEVTSRNAVHRP